MRGGEDESSRMGGFVKGYVDWMRAARWGSGVHGVCEKRGEGERAALSYYVREGEGEAMIGTEGRERCGMERGEM